MKKQVNEFLDYLAVERGFSGNTIGAYRNDLYQLMRFLENDQLADTWGKIDIQILSSFVLNMNKTKNYSITTSARKIAAMKSFFNFLVEEGIVEKDPTDDLASPKIGRTLPKLLSEEDVTKLLEEVGKNETPESHRDTAMFELLYATGMRVSEQMALNIEDINLEEGFVKCKGKGSRERILPVHPYACKAISQYLLEARHLFITSPSQTALFVNRRGERLTRQGFWLILKYYAHKAKIRVKVTPHMLRHSFATHMLRGGASLLHVQELLGHASVATTQVYTHMTTQHLKKEYKRAHPRS